VKAGDVVIAESYAMIDSAQYASVWNDRWLKEYATALIKKNWGSNLSKFQGVQLPGGVMLNGQQIYNDAVEEIKALEEEMSSKYELPVDFYLN
jgi:hypothetical protein